MASVAYLVAHWALDEASRNVAHDSSGNGNDGTLNGGARWETGKYGGAFYLDGVDDYIQIPNLITEGGSIAFWFKPDLDGSDTQDYRIFDVSQGGIYFVISKGANHADINPEDFGFYFEDAANADWQDIEIDPAGVISAGTWLHVVVTWQFGGGSAFLYIDGKQVATSPNTLGALPALHANPRFGVQTIDHIPSRNSAKGVIDDIRMYTQALTENWIT